MKIFKSEQIKQIDGNTIKEEPISSIDLMERAALQLLKWYISHFDRSRHVLIFAGPGNNGGDGLALARLLESNRYNAEVYYVSFTEKTSEDWNANLLRLKSETKIKVNYLKHPEEFPLISPDNIIVDAIFGSGLARPVDGLAGEVIKLINKSSATTMSIDIPSGLFGENNSDNNKDAIIKADYTLTFQFPKISFMFADNAQYLGEWIVLPIGLSVDVMRNIVSSYFFVEKDEVAMLLKKRNKFDHKGTYGHGLLVSGSYGRMGAAVLGAEAALRTGIGLLTCHIPSCGIVILQTSLKEAMAETDQNEKHISSVGKTDAYNAIGIGPGIGTDPETQKALFNLLSDYKKPMIIDADGLNILSLNKEWFNLIPAGSILTPHPKEFERIAGTTDNGFDRLNLQIKFSEKYNCIVVLKGANTSVTTPDGKILFNSTGNPGMATAGSGDTLTGILLSLLSQGYTPENAAILGVYLHGLAGDIAAEESCYESIIASDIIKSLAKAFNKIREQ
jgi:hydroxyethylthiazole kinase-like uncharacterized protein yjeF